MACIQGFEVKGVKMFPDHEGAMIPYGNLYFKGKKIGSFRYDSWGGPMQYDHTGKSMTEKELHQMMEEIPKQIGWHEFYTGLDMFVENLINLKETEGMFKKAQKKANFLLEIGEDLSKHPFGEEKIGLKSPLYYYIPNGYPQDKLQEFAQKAKADRGEGKIYIYRTLDDFNLSSVKEESK